MSTIINGSSPSITFSDSTTQASAGLPLTGGTLTGTTTFTGGIANANGFGVGTAVPSSGSGIAFPATQSASSDANTLDDYEKGTWTPTQGSGLTVVGSFTGTGTYVKIGKQVTVSAQMAATSITAAANGQVCGGLPFTNSAAPVFGVIANAFNATSNCFPASTSTLVYLTNVSLGATTALYFSLTYFV